MGNTKQPTIVGYWYSKSEPQYPKPFARAIAWKGQRDFLQALTKVERKAVKRRFKGFSRCRICGCINGTTEFSNGQYCWPSGLRHYVEAHNVRMPSDFVSYVMSVGATKPKVTTETLSLAVNKLSKSYKVSLTRPDGKVVLSQQDAYFILQSLGQAPKAPVTINN